jgi:hypothetical protein
MLHDAAHAPWQHTLLPPHEPPEGALPTWHSCVATLQNAAWQGDEGAVQSFTVMHGVPMLPLLDVLDEEPVELVELDALDVLDEEAWLMPLDEEEVDPPPAPLLPLDVELPVLLVLVVSPACSGAAEHPEAVKNAARQTSTRLDSHVQSSERSMSKSLGGIGVGVVGGFMVSPFS